MMICGPRLHDGKEIAQGILWQGTRPGLLDEFVIERHQGHPFV